MKRKGTQANTKSEGRNNGRNKSMYSFITSNNMPELEEALGTAARNGKRLPSKDV